MSRYESQYRRYQRTANSITSRGNRNQANDSDAGQLPRITRARYDPHPIPQRNSADLGAYARAARCGSCPR